eukprot:3678148-Alexandrium_andersonii.AAC.1
MTDAGVGKGRAERARGESEIQIDGGGQPPPSTRGPERGWRRKTAEKPDLQSSVLYKRRW